MPELHIWADVWSSMDMLSQQMKSPEVEHQAATTVYHGAGHCSFQAGGPIAVDNEIEDGAGCNEQL